MYFFKRTRTENEYLKNNDFFHKFFLNFFIDVVGIFCPTYTETRYPCYDFF